MAFRYLALPILAFAVSMIDGCSSGSTPITPQTVDGSSQSPVGPASASQSWAAPEASQTKSLVYVASTSSNSVQMYAYKNGVVGALLGELSIEGPGGMCADKSGDVWVTSKYAVSEYAHGGMTPIRELPGEKASAYACAVDPTTGNPAISYNRPYDRSDTIGLVRVFGNGKGSTKFSGFDAAWFLAYDNKGNLFLDGLPCSGCSSGSRFQELFELAKGAAYFQQLTFQGATLVEPTGIAWINPTLLVADSGASYQQPIGYKVLVHGSDATVVQTLSFASAKSAGGLTVRSPSIVVPDVIGNAVLTYSLTGDLVSTFNTTAPNSVVVSKK
ncbi:MAG TPA: hypothetical protein VGK84_07775 [Candidatus Tumulicola sp.]|jgi:hypothetical protein